MFLLPLSPLTLGQIKLQLLSIGDTETLVHEPTPLLLNDALEPLQTIQPSLVVVLPSDVQEMFVRRCEDRCLLD